MTTPNGKVTKWVGLAAGIWVQALAGNGNVFPHFAPALKHLMHINQVEINNLGVAKDFGENVGLLAGMLINMVPAWAILLTGGVEGLLAFGTLWLVMSGHIAPLPYWQMCVVLLIGANSTTCFNTAVLVTTMRNFPESRGMVVGIVKGFVGLSSAIFTQIYVGILGNDATDLVLFLAVGPFVVCLLVMYFIRPVSNSGVKTIVDTDEQNGFGFVHIICIGLAIYLLVATLFETFVPDLSLLMYQVIVGLMLVFLFSPLLVPAKFAYDKYLVGVRKLGSSKLSQSSQLSSKINDKLQEPLLGAEKQLSNECLPEPRAVKTEEYEAESQQQRQESRHDPADYDCLSDSSQGPDTLPQKSDLYTSYDNKKLSSESCSDSEKEKASAGCFSIPRPRDEGVDSRNLLAVGLGAVRRRKGPRRGEDFTLAQAIVKADFWLLFFTYFCGMGTVITAVNNLGQMGQAQGFSDVTIFVSLVGIMNFLGRLGAGALSEYFVRSAALPRTVWMLAAQVLMILGHLLFATAIPGSLYVGSIVLGTCYGVHVGIMVPTASELFGLQHFGMIYNFMMMGNPFGSLLFSGILAGYLYDKESNNPPSVTKVDEYILARYLRNPISSHHPSGPTCFGAHCFQLTFFIMAMVCGVGMILNLILTFRIRRVYLSLYGSRNPSFQNLAEANRVKSSATFHAAPQSPNAIAPQVTIVQSPS